MNKQQPHLKIPFYAQTLKAKNKIIAKQVVFCNTRCLHPVHPSLSLINPVSFNINRLHSILNTVMDALHSFMLLCFVHRDFIYNFFFSSSTELLNISNFYVMQCAPILHVQYERYTNFMQRSMLLFRQIKLLR